MNFNTHIKVTNINYQFKHPLTFIPGMSKLDFLCGLAAGWSQILTGQPLDFIKTKYQLSKAANIRATEIAREIVKDHGVLGFYRGASSLFLGFSFTIALEFSIYEACKKQLLQKY